ncbi:glycerophosphodiester phosphodiesterase [candidate division KSB1 bacterium]|nr:glycerophosphodiester phosphodiesterase [candidate division KSB1 bacterium]
MIRSTGFSMLLSAIALIGCRLPAPATAPLPQRGVCAHRGASAAYPENTLIAFQAAIDLGVHMIETDVRLTRDSTLVLLHDETVDRTTDGSGAISELTLSEVQSLDAGSWKSANFAGERIPTLEQALAIMPRNIRLNLHLKEGRALGHKVAETLVAAGRTRQSFLACNREAAAGAHAVDSSILICNMDRQNDIDSYIDLTFELGSEFIQLYKIPDIRLVPALERLRESRVRVNYCCTDDPEFVVELWRMGVDFVLVNKAAEIMAAAEQAGIAPLIPIY